MISEFFAAVGLPVHLGQLLLHADDTGSLDIVAHATMEFPFIENMPFSINAQMINDAILAAHELGLRVANSVGDDAYRRLHGH